jgi:putative ABC transport system substrate-binding protein
MTSTIDRRQFAAGLASAAAWPISALGQQPAPVIGLLVGTTSAGAQISLVAFRQGLVDAGFVEGRNLSIVYRSAEGDVSRLPALAAELVRIPVAVIAAVGGDNSVHSAKAATTMIPIVFTTASDPIEAGIVSSLSRPAGNVTGATSLAFKLPAKQLGLLRDMVPKLATVGFLASPFIPVVKLITREVQTAAEAAGLQALVVTVNTEAETDIAFAQLAERRIGAIIVPGGTFFGRQRERLVLLAARHRIPAISSNREFAIGGGLISYGAVADTYRQVGLYVARILRGDKPADLPVMQPTRFELVINLKTAKTLGLAIPPGILAIADDVIE